MSIVVFLGPTLARSTALDILPATYLPPASLGDVYSAARRKPWAIVIVDGYFDRVPAIWHKEILWAMSRGVHVYGASSMGALRAAELEAFGMVGCGRVFEAFRDGVLEDDDEVALVHAPSEFGFVAGSEAMVNMRATFEAACDAHVITAAVRDLLVSVAKKTYYAERDYQRTLSLAQHNGVEPSQCHAFREWLPTGKRDVKRADAVEVLQCVAAEAAKNRSPKRVEFKFQPTGAWAELRRAVESRPLDDSVGVEMGLDDDILDELRLQGESYERERDRARARMFAVELGYQQAASTAPLAKHLAADSVQAALGLPSREALHQRFAQEQLTPDGFDLLIEDEAQVRDMDWRYRGLMPAYLCDHLRLNGRYGKLAQRARAKQAALSRRGIHDPSLAQSGLSEAELWTWFFVSLLGQGIPEELAAAANALDFPSVDLMRRAALREYLFRGLSPANEPEQEMTPRQVPRGAG